MPGSIRIARLWGIDVRIHLSWVLIFGLVVIQLADSLPQDYPFWSDEKTLLIAGIAALLFFGSVVAHEFAHAIVARAFRMKVSSITLFLLGGVANLTAEPISARAEFLMAAAGPATSIVIGLLALVVQSLASAPALQPVEAIAGYLGQVNIAVGIFNLLPGFPLDGGRILRSAIWALKKDRALATRLAARGGQLMAALLVVGGAFVIFRLHETLGAWYFLIAYFLWNAASSTLEREQAAIALESAKVRELMIERYWSVVPETSIAELVRDIVLHHNLRTVPVVAGGRCIGLVTVTELQKVDHERWPITAVSSVMRPAEEFGSVGPDDVLDTAVERFRESGVPLLPVVASEALVGFLPADALENYIKMRESLVLTRRP